MASRASPAVARRSGRPTTTASSTSQSTWSLIEGSASGSRAPMRHSANLANSVGAEGSERPISSMCER
jgi:hypothetical protein